MQNIPIVLASEFKRRVTSKAFILTTLLGPIVVLAFFAIIAFISIDAVEDTGGYSGSGGSGGYSDRKVAVVDETGVLLDPLLATESEHYTFVAAESPITDSVRAAVLKGTYVGYILLPAGILTDENPTYFSQEGGNFILVGRLEDGINRVLRKHLMHEQNIPAPIIETLNTHILNRYANVRSVTLSDKGEEAGATWLYSGLGALMGFLIYITMLVYGNVVMQAVVEEKSTRVVEVIVSSVRPFELLMGKVLGIGLMGLIQMTIWAIIIGGGIAFSGIIIELFLDPASLGISNDVSRQDLLAAADITLPSLPLGVFVWFILYFLFGYLIYAGLFAAVGSTVEQQQDAQGLLLPVMMPIILSIVFISPVLQSPHSNLAVILSLIPFTAPVPMVVRLAITDVPLWQTLLSFSLLVAGFLCTIWVSSRIYRVGILMYGKKAKFRDIIRWLRHS